jgi:PAT family beta-lactamase induction signal transducer AmpG
MSRVAAAFAAYADRRIGLLLLLGFSAGAPLPLSAFTLRQWFAESGVDLATIGMTALIGLSYSLKFLWAPLLDRVPPPLSIGRRRGWLVPVQLALIAAILVLAQTDPRVNPAATAMAAVAVAFMSASQDILIDALRIETLPMEKQGAGLAAFVWGYRLALLAASAGALWLVELFGWRAALSLMAALPLFGIAGALASAEAPPPPRRTAGLAQALREAVLGPLGNFVQRPGWLWILLFVGLFKLGEALAGIMTAPFYRALGFARTEVATVSGVFGLFATLAGAAAGGALVAGIGVGRSLVLTGLGQMLSNLMYVALARAGHDMPMLFAQVGIENFTDGLADAAFLSYLSGLTDVAFTATQYALLSSLAALPLRTLGASSGWLASSLGWPRFFLLTTVAALPALAIMLHLLRRFPPKEAGD